MQYYIMEIKILQTQKQHQLNNYMELKFIFLNTMK